MPDSLVHLFRRIQNGVGELGDALLGDRAERALDQDIRATDDALRTARADAAALKAKRIGSEDAVRSVREQAREREAEIAALLARRRKTAAREQAALLLDIRHRLAELEVQATEDAQAEERLAHLAEQLEHRLRRLKHQLGTLRASVSIQRAQEAVAKRGNEPAQPEPAQAARKRAGGNRAGAATHPTAATASDDDAVDALLRTLDPHAPRPAARKQK